MIIIVVHLFLTSNNNSKLKFNLKFNFLLKSSSGVNKVALSVVISKHTANNNVAGGHCLIHPKGVIYMQRSQPASWKL